jgi:hypothetical protein
MSETPQSPSLARVITDALEARLRDLRTWQVGVITEYNSETGHGMAQPVIRTLEEGEEGEIVSRLPQPVNVTVWQPGSGKNRHTFPVAAGDFVLLLFCEVSLDRWREVGGTDVDPGDPRRHSLSDAIAIPGMFSRAAVPTRAPTDAHVVWGDLIRLGSDAATAAVVVQTALDAFCQALINAIANQTSAPNPPGAAALVAVANELFSSGFDPMSPPTSPAGLWSAGTSKVKAE